MSKTLAELRAEKSLSLPTGVERICLDQRVLSDVQRLVTEGQDIELEWRATKAEDPESSKPTRVGEGKPSRLAEIEAELEECYAKMRESEGELLLQARDGGEWQRWKDDHPAREGNESDRDDAFGYCNITDLIADLGRYVVAWNDDEFADGDWDGWFRAKVAPADLASIAKAVVMLHEARITVPKSPSGSSAIKQPATA